MVKIDNRWLFLYSRIALIIKYRPGTLQHSRGNSRITEQSLKKGNQINFYCFAFLAERSYMNLQIQPLRTETTTHGSSTEVITPEYRRYALFVLFLVLTSSHVDRQILAILLEPIKHELVLSDTQ